NSVHLECLAHKSIADTSATPCRLNRKSCINVFGELPTACLLRGWYTTTPSFSVDTLSILMLIFTPHYRCCDVRTIKMLINLALAQSKVSRRPRIYANPSKTAQKC